MSEAFDNSIYRGYLVKGDLLGAMGYLEQFSEKSELCGKYRAIFEREEYITYEVDGILNDILRVYQQYYREVFYLQRPEEDARGAMARRFRELLRLDASMSLDEIEAGAVSPAFTARGFHYIGGVTSGHYGPYIWKTIEDKAYAVELPEGQQSYTVRFLSGFLSRSWMAYLSFGEVGTGGWADDEGIINCVEEAYDREDESFTVSLLKHEAQHAMDLPRYKDISSRELEYRAKLVELIYSRRRNLLAQFLSEADASQAENGHALAAEDIARGFVNHQGCPREALGNLPWEAVQKTAGLLFRESCRELRARYG